MKKLATAAALVVLAALTVTALASAGRASEVMFGASLNAKQEVPAPAGTSAAARGSFTGTLVGKKLTWKLTFSHLTGPATAAHIHMGKKGTPGAVLVPLCGPCKSGVHGKATLSAAVIKALKGHNAYVNVHTAKNPNGEIRGQVVTG